MVNLRTCCISGGTFWGYETYVDIDEIENLKDIVNIVLINLHNDLDKLKLFELINNLESEYFHIHSSDIGDILTSDSNYIIYVCNHC